MARNNGVKAFQLDIDEEDFPFEDNYFDAVFAGEVIEHLFDPDHFLEEVHRALKLGGIFVLSTPNLAAIHNRIALLFGYQPFPMRVSLNYALGHFIHPGWGAHEHVRVMTLRGLRELLKVHKFKEIKIYGAGMSFPLNFKLRGLSLIKVFDKVITASSLLCSSFNSSCREVSARLNIGRAYEPDSDHAQSLDHIRVFTLRSLKDLLKIHGYKISEVKGSCALLPENMRFRGLFKTMDELFAKFPSLSYRVVIACSKK